MIYAAEQPSAIDTAINGSPQSPPVEAGYMLNMSGGTLSSLNISATTQNRRWKGYIGNVSGQLALQDTSSNRLFSWDITTVTGEIYALRNSSIPDWDSITCADGNKISEEQTILSITNSNPDSINQTFTNKIHESFYAGISQISANSCYSIGLNVNNTAQTADFQEVLLSDGPNIIYASILENSTYGFNNQTYDFQMILPENALEGQQQATAYYFYIELI